MQLHIFNFSHCNECCRSYCNPVPSLCYATKLQMLTSSLLRLHRTLNSLSNSGKLSSLLIRLTRLSKGHHCMTYKRPSADRTMSGFASGKLLLEPTLLLICKSGGTGNEECCVGCCIGLRPVCKCTGCGSTCMVHYVSKMPGSWRVAAF